ncbi:MAG: Abi family protein [Lachnospiraceae bacterium]|nr:Abi family protein [Lachnospiraceae bacterium]
MTKVFKSYDDLLVFLKTEKNLLIPDEERAKNILKKTGYFSLISGYKEIFKNSVTKKYNDTTSFDDIYLLYQFDRELRSVFLKYILIAERSIKSSLSYHFSETYGELQTEYLSVKNYDFGNKNNQKGIQKLLSIFAGYLGNISDYIYIKHYQQNHNNVPLWVMIQVITLGQTAHMFDYLKATVPIKVCKEFHDIERGQLHSFLSVMTKHRNACAHGERFFNYKTKDSIKNVPIHKKMNISEVNGRYTCGKNDLFSEVIILKYLLDKEDFRDFYYDLKHCIIRRKPDQRIMGMMGFPANWMNIIRLKV